MRKGGEAALRSDVFNWEVACCEKGPVDGRKAPVGPRGRPGVVVATGAVLCSAADILIYPETG